MDNAEDFYRRRDLLLKGAALIGTGLLSKNLFTQDSERKNKTDQPSSVIDVKSFGATGIQSQNATPAFRAAIQAAHQRGGAVVNVSPGHYTIGTIQLLDNISLNIEAGATLFLSQQKDDFIKDTYTMIFAENARNISVTGKGVINGLAQYDYLEMKGLDTDIAKEIENAKAAGVDMRRYYRKPQAMNTFLFVINDCENFSLNGITLLNSPLWNVRINDCRHVFIHEVTIYSDPERGVNSDGIDICSSSYVTISNSIIETADDSIVLKTISRNGKKANPCENIIVSNCILSSSSTALMIGTETEADIRHVHFSNCVIRNSNKGFGINVQDGATVSDIMFSNLTIDTNRRHWNWWGSAEMCKFILFQRKPSSPLGVIKNITVHHIVAHVRGTSTITGDKSQSLENIVFSDVQIFMLEDNAKDKRVSHAIAIENVKELELSGVKIKWMTDIEKNWKSAIQLKNVDDFTIDNFSGRQGILASSNPAIYFEKVTDGNIRNCKAPEGTGTFLYFKGNEVRDVRLYNNNVKKATTGILCEQKETWKELDVK